MLNKTLHSCN